MSEAQKIAQNRPEVKAKISKAFTGFIFINNGKVNKRVYEEEAQKLVDTGEWKRGKLSTGPRGPVTKLQGRVWIHKDSDTKFVDKQELQSYLDSGWVRGRGKLGG